VRQSTSFVELGFDEVRHVPDPKYLVVYSSDLRHTGRWYGYPDNFILSSRVSVKSDVVR